MAGLTSTGFVAKTLTEAKAELEAKFRALFGDAIDLNPNEPFGLLVGLMAEREAELWDVAAAIHSAFDPDNSTGASLDSLAALTGTIREAATSSEVTATCTGTPTTVLLSGRVASVQGTGIRFVSSADATIAAVSAWAASTAYVVGDRRHNGGNVYEVVTAGTSAGSGGPSGTGSAITDGTVTWKYLGAGTGAVDVAMRSEEPGPKVATARTLTVIETPVSGWSGVINNLDAELGTDEETDAALRLRREDEIRASGKSPLEAIRSNLLQVEDVTAVTVFENITNVTDADGLPPKSVECLVSGGTDADVRQAVFENVGGGIETYGTNSGTVTDSQGHTHTVKFSRPSDVNIWVIANLVIDESAYPADGDAQVEAAITAYGALQKTGKNAVASALEAQCFKVSGVLEAECLIGTSNPPTTRNTVAISLRQLAKYDSSRITVNTTPGTP